MKMRLLLFVVIFIALSFCAQAKFSGPHIEANGKHHKHLNHHSSSQVQLSPKHHNRQLAKIHQSHKHLIAQEEDDDEDEEVWDNAALIKAEMEGGAFFKIFKLITGVDLSVDDLIFQSGTASFIYGCRAGPLESDIDFWVYNMAKEPQVNGVPIVDAVAALLKFKFPVQHSSTVFLDRLEVKTDGTVRIWATRTNVLGNFIKNDMTKKDPVLKTTVAELLADDAPEWSAFELNNGDFTWTGNHETDAYTWMGARNTDFDTMLEDAYRTGVKIGDLKVPNCETMILMKAELFARGLLGKRDPDPATNLKKTKNDHGDARCVCNMPKCTLNVRMLKPLRDVCDFLNEDKFIRPQFDESVVAVEEQQQILQAYTDVFVNNDHDAAAIRVLLAGMEEIQARRKTAEEAFASYLRFSAEQTKDFDKHYIRV